MIIWVKDVFQASGHMATGQWRCLREARVNVPVRVLCHCPVRVCLYIAHWDCADQIYTRSSRCSFPHLYKSLSVIRTTQLFFGGGGVTEQTMVHLFSLSFLFLHLWCNDRFLTLQSAQVSYKTAESVRRAREGFCMCVFTLENQTGSFPAYKSAANCTHMFLCVLVCLCLSQFGSTDAHTLVRSP